MATCVKIGMTNVARILITAPYPVNMDDSKRMCFKITSGYIFTLRIMICFI